MSKFVACLPADSYGNTCYGAPSVIEVQPDGERQRIIAPERLIPHKTLNDIVYQFIEVPGPARELSDEEYVQVLIDAHANSRFIERARKRLG